MKECAATYPIRPSPAFRGRIGSCHSLAFLNAYCDNVEPAGFLLFEAITSVPFGLRCRVDDPNRLITCICDPDIGLDRATQILKLDLRIESRAPNDQTLAIARLREWLKRGPVLLGPLNMDCLKYLFRAEMFVGCDHYVVAIGETREGFLLTDTEGYPFVSISVDNLIAAWRGDCIPEGRGAFVMRQVDKFAAVTVSYQATAEALRNGITNLRAALAHKLGDYRTYQILAEHWGAICADPTRVRGLSYLLPIRIERCMSILGLLNQPFASTLSVQFSEIVESIKLGLNQQLHFLGNLERSLLERDFAPQPDLQRLADLERDITEKFLLLEPALESGI